MIAQKKKKNQYQVNYSANLSNDKHIFQGKKRFQNHIKQAYSSRTLAKVSSKSVIIE